MWLGEHSGKVNTKNNIFKVKQQRGGQQNNNNEK